MYYFRPSPELVLTHHGHLTLPRILEMMRPGAIDPAVVIGRRIRWTYTTTRRDSAETKLASDELKQLHLQMGAAEVIVHRGPWAEGD
jgi:hypothetical protein